LTITSSGDNLINIISIITAIIFGINGNKWSENHLPNRGYDFKYAVSASPPEGAISLHIKEGNTN
jgi:hypothetical protein